MNGFHGIGLTLFSISTLWILGPVRADQPPIAANESACRREKISTGDSKAPFRSVELPVTLVSHQSDGDGRYVKDDEATCSGNADAATEITQPTDEELDTIYQADAAPPTVSSPLGRSLGNRVRLPEPSIEREYVELRVLNAELVARLEMTQAILELQNHYTDQIVLLERQNAKLVSETAELRVKSELNEQLTAGLIERTELAAKLGAAHDWISGRTAYEAAIPIQVHPTAIVANPTYEETIAAIQEDLSNLRRQLPLLKRTPVPFAVSNSVSRENSYVPVGSKSFSANSATGQCPSTEEADSPCREAAAPTIRTR